MKRTGMLLILAALLLSGCAAGSQMEKSDTASVQEMTETHESTGTSEDKGAKAPDQVSDVVSDSMNEKVNDSVNEIAAGSVESPMESAVADIRQLSKQDESSSKSDREPEKADASSQAVNSDASEARESKEESAAVAFFGGGSLAAGGLGMAGGTMVLGGLVAGPALMVVGIVAGAAAKKNLDKAYTNRAEAIQISEQLDTMSKQCEAIRRRTYMFYNLLARLDAYFVPLIYKMEDILKNEGDDYKAYSAESKDRKSVV